MNNILAPFFTPLVPEIIGHRGACNSTPENTIVSILRAAKLGAKWLELDVRLSRDKVPVIFHDDTLDRTTNSNGLVNKLTLKSLKQFILAFRDAFPRSIFPCYRIRLTG